MIKSKPSIGGSAVDGLAALMRQPRKRKVMKEIYIKHGARYMGLCDIETYNNAPRTRYGNILFSAAELPHNYYYGNSSPCDYKVLKKLSRCSFIALMDEQEFERITQTLKCENIQWVAYLSKTGEYL